jgi:Outer membrane protein beta-barrel domain
MKTINLLVFALIFTVQTLFGQANRSIGIIAGPTMTNFWDTPKSTPLGLTDVFEKNPLSSFSVGASYRLGLKKNFFFQSDLTYERKGFSCCEIEYTDFNANPLGTSSQNNHFDYVVFAPSIGFTTRQKFHFEGILGIFGSYLIGTKPEFVNFPSTTPISPQFLANAADDIKVTKFNPFDYGITARTGIGFDFSKQLTVTAHIIGNLGLSKLPKSPFSSGFILMENDKTLTYGLQIGAFYNY